MFFLNLIYAVLVSLGVVGIGRWFWTLDLKKVRDEASEFKAHPCLLLSIYWLTGYFIYEGLLSLLSVTHVFAPGIIVTLGFSLSFWGLYVLLKRDAKIKLANFKKHFSVFEVLVLLGLCGFIFFWNLYPTFDIDSLSSYFVALNNAIGHHGRVFERFADVRLSMPLGENLLYALGFAINAHSTVFAQLIHGIAKIILILGVYGAARSLGVATLALLAPALIVSNEHIVASGANVSVHVNIQLTLALFLSFFSFFVYAVYRKSDYLLLSILAVLIAASCKFLGLVYLAIIVTLIGILFCLHRDRRAEMATFLKKDQRFWIFVTVALVFLASHYIYNWFATGSPFFPASFGPWQGQSYDPVSAELGRRFHYGIGLADALKNVTAFMVWPGILPLKILFPIVLLSGLVASFLQKSWERNFRDGLVFALMSLGMVIIQELYMTFEMRYYRFGIGLYALASTLLLAYLWSRLELQVKFVKKQAPRLVILLVLLVSFYCVRESFDVMGRNRPSVTDILAFVSGQKSEYEVIDQYYPGFKEKTASLKNLQIPLSELGVFVPSNWPHTFYSVAGYHLGLVQTAAIPSAAYFDEGFLAESLSQKAIRYIFNDKIVLGPDYPWAGGKVYALIQDCGKSLQKEPVEILELSSGCLVKWASQKNLELAQKRLNEGMAKIRSQAPYGPFIPPPFGSPDGVYK